MLFAGTVPKYIFVIIITQNTQNYYTINFIIQHRICIIIMTSLSSLSREEVKIITQFANPIYVITRQSVGHFPQPYTVSSAHLDFLDDRL